MALAFRCSAAVSPPPPSSSSSSSQEVSRSSLFPCSNLLLSTRSNRRAKAKNPCSWRCEAAAPEWGTIPTPERRLDHIPKQFREENLVDGLMDNYKNVPSRLYGLTSAEMGMFMAKDNPITTQGKKRKEESISSASHYLSYGGMNVLGDMDGGTYKQIMTAKMSTSGMFSGLSARRGADQPDTAPPDLPSLLLDSRIVYLGMPIVAAVTELIVAQLMWLDFDDPKKPIHMYITSLGTQDETRQLVGSDTDAFAIADMMAHCKAKVYTVNVGAAYGYAAMLLALGEKGKRAVLPNASTKLYLPKVFKSGGGATDMWIKGRELEDNTDCYIELLAKGTGKPKEEITKDIKPGQFFSPEEAIAYGLADKIIEKKDTSLAPNNIHKLRLLAKAKAAQRRRRRRVTRPQEAPPGPAPAGL